MTAEADAFKSLTVSGLRSLLTWGAPVAFALTNELYNEDVGHGQGTIGYMNFVHLCDLLDRATGNGRFKLGSDVEGIGADFIERGITPEAFRMMPALEAGSVSRNDYKRSPGWSADGYRVLLQSYPFGKIDRIKWIQRSNAKRDVASQKFIGAATLFKDEDYGLESVSGIPNDDDFEGVTLVAAHAYNPVTGQYELYIGQSKNPQYKGDSCWHWRTELLSGGTPIGGIPVETPPTLPGDGATTNVDDIDVRMRKPGSGKGAGAANA